MSKEMYQAYELGELKEAVNLAEEYLKLAETMKSNWNYGNAIHHSNLILGRVALKQGLKEKAKEYLLKAGKTAGSPQLNTFGPNMALAKELLELGENIIVLEYLKQCKIFWRKIFSMIKMMKWERLIKKGEIPNFRGNLMYH